MKTTKIPRIIYIERCFLFILAIFDEIFQQSEVFLKKS